MADRRELTLRGYRAMADGDRAAMKELMHPDIELESRFSSVAGTTYHGYEGIDAWLDDLDDAWEHLEVEFESLVNEGDDVTLVHVTLHARGRESGVEFHEPVTQRHRWRGDRIIKIEYVERTG